MMVFDLECAAAGHVFEAWFGSSADFEAQSQKGLLACPLCGSGNVSKAVMAPSIPAKSNQRRDAVAVAEPAGEDAAKSKALLAALAEAQAKLLKDSTWVGRDFDRQARAMDAGEIPHKSVHGEVSPAEAKALTEDGIGVMPLLLPVIPPGKRN